MSNRKTTGQVPARRVVAARPARAGATAVGVVDLHRTLLETASELTAEFREIPAGSVMRCFGRSVKRARAEGFTGPALPEAARRIAQSHLSRRGTAGRRPAWAGVATA